MPPASPLACMAAWWMGPEGVGWRPVPLPRPRWDAGGESRCLLGW